MKACDTKIAEAKTQDYFRNFNIFLYLINCNHNLNSPPPPKKKLTTIY